MALDICNCSSGLIKITTAMISHPSVYALGLGSIVFSFATVLVFSMRKSVADELREGSINNVLVGCRIWPKMEYCRCKYSSSYDPLRLSHNSPTLFKLLQTLTSWVLSLQYCKPIDSAWEQVNTQHTSSNTHNCYIIDSFPGPACPASHYLQYWERW